MARFLFGYDIGVISGCLIMPDFINRFGEMGPDGQMFLSSSRQSIITSLLSAGGALAQAFTSDRFGRRGSILIWSAIFTVGVAIQTGTTFSIVQITIGRFIAGLGVGALSAIVPLYNGETAPKALRGTLLVLYQLQIIIGYILDLATHSVPNSASWRVPVGLQLVWGLILLSGIFFLPESPRHLLGTGRDAEARKVVAELNGVPEDDPLVDEIIEELDFAIKAENEGGKATWMECFSTRNSLWKRTVNGMMLQFIQQLNGQNFYCHSNKRTLQAGLVGHFTLAPANTAKELLTRRNKQGGDTLIAFAVLHVFSFSVFWGPTPWVYLGESFPLRVRPKSIALGSATNCIGPLILLIFFGMLLFGYVYVYLFIPETKGLSLEEVDELYRSGIKPWNSSDFKPHLTDEIHNKVRPEKEVSENSEKQAE
ncbi:hypothetical protein H0H93_004735 [Arthromyces matolae]|nr:hypothetical protein H0H93_004735 [Arthromyces matolae]